VPPTVPPARAGLALPPPRVSGAATSAAPPLIAAAVQSVAGPLTPSAVETAGVAALLQNNVALLASAVAELSRIAPVQP